MPKKKGFEKLAIQFNTFAGEQAKNWSRSRIAGHVTRLLHAPINILLSPIALAFNIAGSAPRGYGIPEFISKLSYASVFAIATLGTYDVALDLGKKLICQRDCNTCSGWQAMRCTMCKGSGRVHYQVKNCSFRRGEKATAEYVADAIVDNRAEIVHLPSSVDFHTPLPSKECPSCDGSGVMSCPECKNKLHLTISADDLMEPPWRAYNVMRKLEYPYEHIVHSMKDPSIAAFWLLTFPQVVGGFEFDEDVKQRIWWQYKESMRYDQLRDVVAKREPGWEYMQEALVSLDPVRARDDPAVVKNIPFFKAKKALESEVTKLNPPPRPQNWGELELPLSTSSWSEEELKDPNKFNEMTVLLNAQKEIANRILDEQWQAKWRQQKLNEMLEEKVHPYVEEIDNGELSRPIIIQQGQDQKREAEPRKRRWWFF